MVYSTDSQEHRINTGEEPDPELEESLRDFPEFDMDYEIEQLSEWQEREQND